MVPERLRGEDPWYWKGRESLLCRLTVDSIETL
jgi:hypothetical protein